MSRRLLIHGRVQGVFFRDWTVETARSLGLDGWVRNRADGSVEALVSGEAQVIARFVALCHEGPPAARVDRVEVEESGEAVAPGFTRRATQ
ncbi:acylphosphatase [Sphingomonas oleivorans]|uniref:Acylphosphatase n=1 Tax=Sphingomonas oleivorans TaxID=1735121 RepID=A0A2T5FXU8_9SPHN|nr:acylphosphatase [Sphingomonas oleivorans]PTQ10904.1 acylphosphatase [Sphingomonas oleivorans]